MGRLIDEGRKRESPMPDPKASSDPHAALRELSHARFYALWQRAKTGDALGEEDARTVQAMRDHPEYYSVWEHANEFLAEPVTVLNVNPFLHVTLHTLVENQAVNNEPAEVRAVLEYKTSHKTPRHQVVHAIANALVELMWPVLHDHQPFDNAAYRRQLAKLLPHAKRPSR
jgi:hypothetical protein